MSRTWVLRRDSSRRPCSGGRNSLRKMFTKGSVSAASTPIFCKCARMLTFLQVHTQPEFPARLVHGCITRSRTWALEGKTNGQFFFRHDIDSNRFVESLPNIKCLFLMFGRKPFGMLPNVWPTMVPNVCQRFDDVDESPKSDSRFWPNIGQQQPRCFMFSRVFSRRILVTRTLICTSP